MVQMSLFQTILVTSPGSPMKNRAAILAPNFHNSLTQFNSKTPVNHLYDLFIPTWSPLPFLLLSWIQSLWSFYKPRKDRLPRRQQQPPLDFAVPKQNSNYHHQFSFDITPLLYFLPLTPEWFKVLLVFKVLPVFQGPPAFKGLPNWFKVLHQWLKVPLAFDLPGSLSPEKSNQQVLDPFQFHTLFQFRLQFHLLFHFQ